MPASLLARYRDPLVVLVLILLPLVFFVAHSKEPAEHNAVDRIIVTVSTPIQWAVVNTMDGIADVWGSYVALVDVQQHNQQLLRENSRLRQQLAEREEHRIENERLRDLLDLEKRSFGDSKAILAQVIATSPSPLFRSLRVDRGTSSGVQVGAAVITHDGVIGRVAAAGRGYADVMLLVDSNSSVDVLVQRTRARARVKGTGRDAPLSLNVQYLERTADVEPGDVLITSGIGGVFPKGMRIGTVLAVMRGAFGLYQNVSLAPSVNFGLLEEVMILPSRAITEMNDVTEKEGVKNDLGSPSAGGIVGTVENVEHPL